MHRQSCLRLRRIRHARRSGKDTERSEEAIDASLSNAPEIAMVYVGLGEKDQAMNWLEKGYAERFNPWVLLRPGFDPLRSDPRFEDLLRRIGLPR